MKNMNPWVLKYLPTNTKEVYGQQKPIEDLRQFIINHKAMKETVCLLHGGVGSGKTSSVQAIGEELGLEVVELNASDVRNKDAITSFVGSAMGQQSLFFKGKIILIDEIDGLSGTKDRGGIAALQKLIDASSFPVVCTLADAYDQKFKALKKKAFLVPMNTLDYRSISKKLQMILDAEGCEYDEEALKSIARRSGGDMRGAINDLQVLSLSGARMITPDVVKELDDQERNHTEKLTNAMLRVLKTTDALVAKDAFEQVQEDPDTIMLWMEENIPKEYQGKDLANAFDYLSKADVYKGRIRRWQHWRFLVYIYAFLTAGVAVSKEEKYKTFVKYGPPTKLLKLWQAKMKYGKRKEIAAKISLKTHTSSRRVIQDVIPYLKVRMKNKQEQLLIQNEFDLEDEEIAWLAK